MQNSFDRRVHRAEGQKKIFDNRVKYILFLVTVLTGITILLDKCPSTWHKSQIPAQTQQLEDSLAKLKKDQAKKESSATSQKHHPRNLTAPGMKESKPQMNGPLTEKKNENVFSTIAPKVTTPIQTAFSDNIEFKLISAEGSIRGQTIKMILVLTTSAANWYIMSEVHSIIDPDGNEYKLKAFTIGANDYFPEVNLTTDVPIKCTYTFGGVLPSVSNIKLFKYSYTHSAGQPYSVEFRDIPINWK